MLFNSIEFAIYLPIVFLLYWFVCQKKIAIQNVFIVLVSYIFYGWWDWRFLLLMGATTLFSWLSGLYIQRFQFEGRFRIAKFISFFQYIFESDNS